MKRGGARILLAVLALASGLASCTGGVDTNTPPPGDDDDAATTLTPTPTETATETPTTSPTPAGLSGDPWTTTATPASGVCSVVQQIAYGSAGVATIGVATTGANLYFDIGMHLNPAIGIGDEASGTVDGAGNFTQTFSYCTYDGASTRKFVGSWTGVFAPDGLSFTDSTLVQKMYLRTGADYRTTCATNVTAANAFGSCSTSGVTFSIDGVKQ